MPVLGCLVGKNGVRPDPEKVRVINEWSTPSNFLGLTTYFCKYMEIYALPAGRNYPVHDKEFHAM
ncbi:Hypothetical protein PHPALM_13844 [Phytophthora palmivora]|uniref:Reverse transcriptase n=1 Tax=Phytophthora palmivora TaxID=4796 RepID=A0A2P4XWA5_9STRA|nr:Hypothetical protein PHPALM_13844 [Phytophthora palmivora]